MKEHKIAGLRKADSKSSKGHRGCVSCLAVSSDGRFLVSSEKYFRFERVYRLYTDRRIDKFPFTNFWQRERKRIRQIRIEGQHRGFN